MKLDLFIAAILFANFMATFADRMIVFYHTDVGKHYQNYIKTAVPYGQPVPGRFSELKKDLKRELCLKTVDVTHFYVLGEDMEPAQDDETLDKSGEEEIRIINEFYTSVVVDKLKYVSVQVHEDTLLIYEENSPIVSARGIMCYWENDTFMAIEDGYDEREFYIIFKSDHLDSEKSIFLGLAEYPAQIDDETKTQDDLEFAFRSSHKFGLVGNEDAKKNICKLSSFNQFRVCGSVFMAWKKDDFNETLNWIRYRDADETDIDCIENASIKFNNAVESPKYDSVNLIPCTVNGERGNPSFYVTADQQAPGKAFVFELPDRDEFAELALVLRVQNVAALKNAFEAPILHVPDKKD